MPIDVMIFIGAVNQLDHCLGVIGKYVARLKADPDHAAADLAEALEEIEKSCRSLDEVIKKYLTLGYKSNALNEGSDLLLEVGGGGLLISVKKGLGSCSKMDNLYQNHLYRWFERVFKNDSKAFQEIKSVFDELCSADSEMFKVMENAARRVQEHANVTLELLEAKTKEIAREHVRGSASELNQLRVRMNELMAKPI
jgi:hypothetical protein